MLRRLSILFLSLTSLSGCEQARNLKATVTDGIIDFVPTTVDVQLGDRAFSELSRQQEAIDDQEVLDLVTKLSGALVSEARKELDVPYRIHVTADSMVNAFALPGGHIILPAGLLVFAKSSDEVAGVLAHELAHVTERHSVQQALTGIGLGMVLQAVLGDASEIVRFFVASGANLLTNKHSRDHERDADRVGFAYLNRANIKSGGLADFFGRLATLHDQRDGRLSGRLKAMFSTHPVTAERIARLAEMEAEDGDADERSALTPGEFKALQSRLVTLDPGLEKPGS